MEEFTVWEGLDSSMPIYVRDTAFVPGLYWGCLSHTKLGGVTTGISAGGPLNHLGRKRCLSPCHFCDNLIKMQKKNPNLPTCLKSSVEFTTPVRGHKQTKPRGI